MTGPDPATMELPPGIADRVAGLDWPRLQAELDAGGYAVAGPLLSPAECAELRAAYDDDGLYRSRIVMKRYNFGSGDYSYFAYPLPPSVAALREALYARLAPLANLWQERTGSAERFPADHGAYLADCHAAGQTRPTPLVLRYGAGDYNCLHQDIYGDRVFPLQATILLSDPHSDFIGGEFVLTEQRPRMQSRVDVVPLGAGDAVFFAVNQRPVAGTRGTYRVRMRHGVSRVRSGERYTLGLIFHDAA